MANASYFNVVKFAPTFEGRQAIFIKPEGDWTWDAGIKPSIFHATVRYDEFAKLDLSDPYGTLEFYFAIEPAAAAASAAGGGDPDHPVKPDLSLFGFRVVDVEPTKIERVNAELTPRFVEYRVAFADARDRFSAPFGGRLFEGEINKEPFNASGTKDDNGNTTRTRKECVQLCLAAMGIGDVFVHPDLSDAARPMNLDWRGNLASEELEKLLAEAGFVFVVQQSGKFAIQKIGKGTIPTPPTGLTVANMDYPGIDRRGGFVIFTSAPMPTINTATYTLGGGSGDDGGQGLDSLQFVILDTDNQWKALEQNADLKILNGAEPDVVVQSDFDQVDEKWVVRARNMVYACLRLDPDAVGPQPMSRFNWESAKWAIRNEIDVQAKTIYDAVGTGLATMTKDRDYLNVPVAALLDRGRVLVLQWSVGKFTGDKVQGNIATDFTALTGDDLKVRVTREVWNRGDDGRWRPQFFRIGFKQDVQGIVEIGEGDIDDLLASGQAAAISAPELRIIQVDGQDTNRTDVKGLARSMADGYIGGSGNAARLIEVAGFWAGAELSGVINRIEFSFSPPKTAVKCNTWFFPHDRPEYRYDPKAKGGAAGQQFPKQAATAAKRTAEGIAGGQQPAAMLLPSQSFKRPISGAIKIVGEEAGGGMYKVKLLTGSATVKPGDDFKPNNDNAIAGMSDGVDALMLNLVEGQKTADGHGHVLPDMVDSSGPIYGIYDIVGKTDEAKPRPIIVARIEAPQGLFAVTLSKDGGGDGDETSPATYTYTVKLGGNKVLAAGVGPQWGRSFGSRQVATQGMGYLNLEGTFKLAYAHEVENAEACP